MKKHWIVWAALAAAMAADAQAQMMDSPWLVRLRAVHLDMSHGDSTGLGLRVENKTIPEVDASYFFDKNFATELSLTAPKRHTVSSAGGGSAGSFKQMPTTLMLQYHFADVVGYKPYVGLGVNYTRFSHVNLGGLTLDSHSWGAAVQAGVDIPMDKNWSVNLDLKKLYVKADVGGAGSGSLKLHPLMAGVGLGYRF